MVSLGGNLGIGEDLLDQGGRLGALLVATVSAVAVGHLEVEGSVVVARHVAAAAVGTAVHLRDRREHFGQKTDCGRLPNMTRAL